MKAVTLTDFKDIPLLVRGKVRDIYDLGENMLIVTTDRVSAFDVILPDGIPNKGKVLTAVSEFWFKQTSDIIENHLLTTDISEMPEICLKYRDVLEGRSMLVKKASPFPVEFIARGYITGSGLKDYKNTGGICGIKLPKGLEESMILPEPIFTPATKEELGQHDINISYTDMETIVGKKDANDLKEYTMALYKKACEIALKKGIVIADTKFEFGRFKDKIILIDEALTPDSSRFWRASDYRPGVAQDSMDKQVIRDYLSTLDWDKTPPAPSLPGNIIKAASDKYLEIMHILLDHNYKI